MEKEKIDDNNLKITHSLRTDAFISDKKLIELSKKSIVVAQEYGESPERWYNLVSYCFCVFARGFQWLSFSSLSNEFSIYYEISSWRIKFFRWYILSFILLYSPQKDGFLKIFL